MYSSQCYKFSLGISKDVSRNQHQEYKIITISSLTKNISTIDALFYWKHQNPHLSNKITSEYIEKIKHTRQCQRMWIQNKPHKSVMISQNRGRLANQLTSFALQYAMPAFLGMPLVPIHITYPPV